jgi:hypothetical protein
MLVSTLTTLFRSKSVRNADVRSGVSPQLSTKSISAASRFFAVIAHSFLPPVWAIKTIRTVPLGCKSANCLQGISGTGFSSRES